MAWQQVVELEIGMEVGSERCEMIDVSGDGGVFRKCMCVSFWIILPFFVLDYEIDCCVLGCECVSF